MSRSPFNRTPASTRSTRGWHHAYLLVGGKEEALTYVEDFAASLDIPLHNNADYILLERETFGIGDAREVAERASRKAFGNGKIFVLIPGSITHEAQNALLKTLEDAPEATHFFVIVRSEQLVLQTLISRMQVERLTLNESGEEEVEKFISLTPDKRMLFAKKFADDEKSLSLFLDNLLGFLKSQGKADVMKQVLTLRNFSDDRSSSPRLVLEHLALVV